jgi:hypothetical protein
MRRMTVRLLLLAVLAACSAGPQQPTRPPDPINTPPATTDPGAPQDVEPLQPSTQPPVEQGKRADGASCLVGDECTSGVCEGQGCGDNTPGKCAPKARGCTRDLRTYCGCDGKTFQASGSCPGRRFSAKETCGGS